LACTGGKKSPPPAREKNGRFDACAGVAGAVLELFSAVDLVAPTSTLLPENLSSHLEPFSLREKVAAAG